MNLHLRALEPEDLGYLYDCENSPSLQREGTELALYSQHTLRRFIETSFLPVAETRQLRLIACEDAQRMGILDLYDIDLLHRHATLGLVVYPLEFRGKGYGLALLQLAAEYARRRLYLRQLWAEVLATNGLGLRLFDGAPGWRKVGTRESWQRDAAGAWVDVACYQCALRG